MESSLGEQIRQLRRQQSLTQTDLGGDRYSKSYVSAVEREKIIPSYQALHFFAEQLDQPTNFFDDRLQQLEMNQSTPQVGVEIINDDDGQMDQELLALLDTIIKGAELNQVSLSQFTHLATIQTVRPLSLQKRARYAFLQGLLAQERKDFVTALSAFEYALALVSEEYQSVILDAIGTNYYLTQSYQCALTYYTRSLHLLQQQQEEDSDLYLLVAFHCGNTCRELGDLEKAVYYYENARRRLRANHNIKIAGELYLGLGYSMYGSLCQKGILLYTSATALPQEQVERTFQHALSFLIQSRTLYQVSSDLRGVSLARLTQIMVLLDFCSWRLHLALERGKETGQPPLLHYGTLLDEADEQCQQILLEWQDALRNQQNTHRLDDILYITIAYRMRVYNQKAMADRMRGYHDTALRERLLAQGLYNEVVSTFMAQVQPDELLEKAINISGFDARYNTQFTPSPLDLIAENSHISLPPYVQAEFLIAAGEVLEETGRAAQDSDFSMHCYMQADEYLLKALRLLQQSIPGNGKDHSYLTRTIQRITSILEERIHIHPEVLEENIAAVLVLMKEMAAPGFHS